MHLFLVPLHSIVGRQPCRHSLCEHLLEHFSLFVTVPEGADIFLFFTAKFIRWHTVRTLMHLIVKWIEKDLNQRMRVGTVHFVFAFDPRLLIVDVTAPLGYIVEVLGRSTEILHPMSVIAVRPIMFFIQDWTE